jgi:hypothetical protein
MIKFDEFVTCVLREYTFESKKKKSANPTTACANPVEEEGEEEDNLDNDGENSNQNGSDSEKIKRFY